MKSLVFIIIFLMNTLVTNAQYIEQTGVAYRYNGKNPRTPLSGVFVKSVSSPNGTISKEKSGTFTLKLQGLKMGNLIGKATVIKQGMIVFNQQAVDEWSVRKNPLVLILCDANEFQKQKNGLIAIGRKQAEMKYKKKLAELHKEKEKMQLTLDKYYTKLDSIDQEYQNTLKNMDKYADMFARIDQSEIDSMAQRAMTMFQNGQVEEALKIFEKQNYLKSLETAIRVKSQAVELRKLTERADSLADKDIEGYVKSIKVQVAAYKMTNEWEKAGKLLKGLADRLNKLGIIYEYANFALNQKQYTEAEVYYNKIKDKILQLAKDNPQAYTPTFVIIYGDLATLYRKENRFTESEHIYKIVIAIREELAKENPKIFDFDLASTYNDLGNLYMNTKRFTESEQMYKAAITICERLAKENPKIYDIYLATAYNNLGIVYSDIRRFSESEQMYKTALAIYERLAKENPQAYGHNLATSYGNLGNLYMDLQRFTESEQMHKATISIRERLAKKNPKAYEPDLAGSYYNLADLYRILQQFTKSEQMYKASLSIREHLAKENPKAYEPDLAGTYYNFALLYYNTQYFKESEQMYKSALTILEHIHKDNPNLYNSDLRNTLTMLSYTSIFSMHYAEAEGYARRAIELDSTKHTVYSNLASSLLMQGKYAEAEKIYRQYKNELKKSFLGDFGKFEKAGAIPDERKADVEKIKKMLNE